MPLGNLPGRVLLAVALSLALGLQAASAAPSMTTGGADPSEAQKEAAAALVEKEDYEGAVDAFQKLIKDYGADADTLNYLAYSHRKLGHLDEAEEIYEEALALDPDHLGALEYQGELFVLQGRLAEADANLARLSELCGNCEERDDLAEAIEAARSPQKAARPSSGRW